MNDPHCRIHIITFSYANYLMQTKHHIDMKNAYINLLERIKHDGRYTVEWDTNNIFIDTSHKEAKKFKLLYCDNLFFSNLEFVYPDKDKA